MSALIVRFKELLEQVDKPAPMLLEGTTPLIQNSNAEKVQKHVLEVRAAREEIVDLVRIMVNQFEQKASQTASSIIVN